MTSVLSLTDHKMLHFKIPENDSVVKELPH